MDASVIKSKNDDNFADAQERAKQVIARGDEISKAINYSIYTSDMSFELRKLLMGLVSTYKDEGFGLVGVLAKQDHKEELFDLSDIADREAKLLLRHAEDVKAQRADQAERLAELSVSPALEA